MPSSDNAWAVIVAAGESRRFGRREPKQLASLAGKPLLLHALEPFREHSQIAGVTLVLPQRIRRDLPDWLGGLESKGVRLATGGPTRTDSVRLGLASIPRQVEIVAIHDGARPLITAAGIDRVLAEVSDARGAIAGRRMTDSLKEVNGERRIVRSLGRDGIWVAETPQAFPRALIDEVHRRAHSEGATTSDCAALFERYGFPIVMVELEEPNLKITRPADLELAEAWIRRSERRDPHCL
jgi:2-C-methyl-D-erythritol 4-phosphate cytidylyltransferase